MKKIADLFPKISPERRRELLTIPSFTDGPLEAVLDTDTFNEIDDQFAMSLAIRSPERLNMRAVIAAPFYNDRSEGPADGMEKSYQEILKLLQLLKGSPENFAYRGSISYLPDAFTPVESEGARRIVELAKECKAAGKVLYIMAIGAVTNVASALLMAPEIIDSVVVVWLGGHAIQCNYNDEFNLKQDIPAAQVLFESGVPLVWVPALGVSELLMITLSELELRCKPLGELGEFLYSRTFDYMHGRIWQQKVIWDISTILYLVKPEYTRSALISSPILQDDKTWVSTEGRHEIRVMTWLNRWQCFDALFETLAK